MDTARAIDLPPGYRLITLRESGDAFAHAASIAAREGAGSVIHVGRFDLAEFAVVLEPEETLRSARWAIYAGLVALAEALAGFAPAEKLITFEWPDTIRVDGAIIGGGRLGWPSEAGEDDVPEWLVFGAMIRTVSLVGSEPAFQTLTTALTEEGFDDLGSGRLLESFARHLMAIFDLASEAGSRAIIGHFLDRLETGKAGRRSIDADGDLILHAPSGEVLERRSLAEALAAPAWRATPGWRDGGSFQ